MEGARHGPCAMRRALPHSTTRHKRINIGGLPRCWAYGSPRIQSHRWNSVTEGGVRRGSLSCGGQTPVLVLEKMVCRKTTVGGKQ